MEDTSLYLEGLNGLPGPLIKWFLQKIGLEGIVQHCKKYKQSECGSKNNNWLFPK